MGRWSESDAYRVTESGDLILAVAIVVCLEAEIGARPRHLRTQPAGPSAAGGTRRGTDQLSFQRGRNL